MRDWNVNPGTLAHHSASSYSKPVFLTDWLKQYKLPRSSSSSAIQKGLKQKRHWWPRSFALDFTPGRNRFYYAPPVSFRWYIKHETCRLRDICLPGQDFQTLRLNKEKIGQNFVFENLPTAGDWLKKPPEFPVSAHVNAAPPAAAG